jgi:hypothetical protein
MTDREQIADNGLSCIQTHALSVLLNAFWDWGENQGVLSNRLDVTR